MLEEWNNGSVRTREESVLGVFDFLEGGGQDLRGGPAPPVNWHIRQRATVRRLKDPAYRQAGTT
jgi:hypothetical protein